MKPDLKKALESALNEKVVITKDKKEIVLTKAALGIQQLVNQFAKGDRYARRDLFQYAVPVGSRSARQGRHRGGAWHWTTRRSSMPFHADRATCRRREASADDHVKAPPDLLDDDLFPGFDRKAR